MRRRTFLSYVPLLPMLPALLSRWSAFRSPAPDVAKYGAMDWRYLTETDNWFLMDAPDTDYWMDAQGATWTMRRRTSAHVPLVSASP